jgi:hypothetical protein
LRPPSPVHRGASSSRRRKSTISKITPCTLPAEDIACFITEIEREYPTLPWGKRRIARRQLRQLRDELGIRDEFDRIETEQRYFAEVETYAGTIVPDGFELPF